MNNKNITILGAGSWGTAIALALARNGHDVLLWDFFAEHCFNLQTDRENKKYLPSHSFPKNLHVQGDLVASLAGAEMVVQAVPSHAVRSVLDLAAPLFQKSIPFVNLSKGFEKETLFTMSQVATDVLGSDTQVFGLYGPSHASEVAEGLPTAVVLAGRAGNTRDGLLEIFQSQYFYVTTSDDLIGVEVAGSLKNIFAIATGLSDGLELGRNARAALLTASLREMINFGTAFGGQYDTFFGLAGIGDLIATCTSRKSRNYNLGLQLAAGNDLESILQDTGKLCEGVTATRLALQVAEIHRIKIPIIQTLGDILFNRICPRDAMMTLFRIFI